MKINLMVAPMAKAADDRKKELKKIAAIMRAAVDLGAFEEKMDHRYQNRTGTLEASTKGRTTRMTSSEIRVELGMYTGYAAYVRGRGLSTIDSAAARVKQTLDDAFDKLGR